MEWEGRVSILGWPLEHEVALFCTVHSWTTCCCCNLEFLLHSNATFLGVAVEPPSAIDFLSTHKERTQIEQVEYGCWTPSLHRLYSWEVRIAAPKIAELTNK